jgi:hypothetical protein
MKKVALLATLGALLVAIPAAAKPAPHASVWHRHHLHHRGCWAREARYRAAGTLSGWALTENADGTYSGTVTVNVLKGDRHAQGNVGTATTYTVSQVRVILHRGVSDPPAAGSRIRLLGRITAIPARCTALDAGFTPTITIHRIEVRIAAA